MSRSRGCPLYPQKRTSRLMRRDVRLVPSGLMHRSNQPSVHRNAARLDRPGPFVDFRGDEFRKVFGATALDRCNILTNRFEALANEWQIKDSAQRLIEVLNDVVRRVLW